MKRMICDSFDKYDLTKKNIINIYVAIVKRAKIFTLTFRLTLFSLIINNIYNMSNMSNINLYYKGGEGYIGEKRVKKTRKNACVAICPQGIRAREDG